MKKRIFLLLALVPTLLPGLSGAAVRAWLDQPTVYVGDPVTLTIEADNPSAPRPDLTPLETSFRILGTGTSTSVSIVNGRSSTKKSWRITLQPLAQGKLEIPAINVGNEQTQSLTVTVTDVPEAVKQKLRDHVTLEASIDTDGKPVRVQQQISYTLKLITDDSILSGELIPPNINNAVMEQLGEDKRYQIVRNGKRYNVIERHFVISPERSGKLEIPPAQFRGKMRVEKKQHPLRHSRSPFDNFFDRDDFFRDPFGNDFFDDDFFAGTPFGPRGKPVRTSSKALSIDVLPIPEDYQGKNWLPAEEVKIQDSWRTHRPTFKVGEPVVRSLRFQIKGLAGSQIPPLEIGEPKGMRIYPDQAKTDTLTDGETVYGVSEQSITYIPQQAGEITIPPISIEWWNTRTEKLERTTLPEVTVQVQPGAGGERRIENRTVAKSPAGDSSPEKTENTEMDQKATAIPSDGTQPGWLLGALLGLALLAVGGFLLWRTKNPTAKNTAHEAPKPSTQGSTKLATRNKTKIRQRLRQACETGDARAAANALLELAQTEWPNDPPRNLGELATRLQHGAEPVRALDRHLYGRPTSDWDGHTLWEALKNGLKEKESAPTISTDGPRGLYPNR